MTKPAAAGPAAAAAARATWRRLLAGNVAYQKGQAPRPDVAARARLLHQQTPQAVVLGCADSRVPVEEVFAVGPGELFTVRTAGLSLGPAVLGSIEYAVSVLHVPLLVVLGHTACGAVHLATQSQAPDLPANCSLPQVVQAVHSAWRAACPGWWASAVPQPSAQSEPFHAHIHGTVWGILTGSSLLATAVQRGQLAVVGAEYDLASGQVQPLPQLQHGV
ncbi:carbonic anhydrase [Buchananella hordeovulneris]|uniref:carbonic anhydrase n=1 Tax=Buchananella hordeovulneris TaxID=52770 RepID=UPI001639693A|nr:carbonic anhydrase [Buchananella hordeovulneris]